MSEVKKKTQLSLGDLLQRARCNKKLSREQVARELHVQPQVLALFEHNDFNRLNVPEHFIVQHLSDYADLVDLDADAVVDIYHQGGVINLAPPPSELPDDNKVTKPPEATVRAQQEPAAKPSLAPKKIVKKELQRLAAVEMEPDLSAEKLSQTRPLSARKEDQSPLSQGSQAVVEPSAKFTVESVQSGISARCEDAALQAPSVKSEARSNPPIKKGRRVLRWSFNLLVLVLIIAAAFFWYREQVGQLNITPATSTVHSGQTLTPFAEPSAAEQQAAEKMKLEQHIQSNEAMAAQYKILKVPRQQTQETDQS